MEEQIIATAAQVINDVAATVSTPAVSADLVCGLPKMQFYEIVSMIASITTAISLTVKSLYRMRWLNFFGCLGFTIYGLLIGAWSLAAVNAYIAIIDIIGIIKLKNSDKSTFYFGTIGDIGEKYFEQFYSFYEDDIRSFFPEVKYGDLELAQTYVLFRDMIPVGIFSLKKESGGKQAKIIMDYVVPRYRDGQFGSVMYVKKAYVFRDQGVEEFVATTKIPSHVRYLKGLGFLAEEKEDGFVFLSKKIVP